MHFQNAEIYNNNSSVKYKMLGVIVLTDNSNIIAPDKGSTKDVKGSACKGMLSYI